ncbi:MAG: hypothetical protein AAGI34_12915 [Pseudomonadota bacterium]
MHRLILAAALLVSPAQAATVITLGDFTAPVLEDFNAQTPGPIAVTDPIFTALGISAISTVLAPSEPFENRSTASRGLGATANDPLIIAEPGTSGVTIDGITLSFNGDITRIGFGLLDSQGTLAVAFRDDGVLVDSINVTINTVGQLRSVFLQADQAFDTIQLSINNGFVLDNLRVEQSEITLVPLPPTLALLAAGLAGLGLVARRRKRH